MSRVLMSRVFSNPGLINPGLILAVAFAAAGCSGRRAEWQIPPDLDPPGITGCLMKAADGDGDGRLTGDELMAVPALQSAVSVLDADGDSSLAAAEVEAWLTSVVQEGLAAQEAPLRVTQDGRPVADALVRLVPEPCMGDGIEPAEGRTDETGLVFLNIPTRRTGGVRCGLYRMEIRGKGVDGQPLPARYNSATTLGYALGAGLPEPRTPEVDLD